MEVHLLIGWTNLGIGVFFIIISTIVLFILAFNQTNNDFIDFPWYLIVLLTLGFCFIFHGILWLLFGRHRKPEDVQEINRLRQQRACPEFTTAICGLDLNEVQKQCDAYGTIRRSF